MIYLPPYCTALRPFFQLTPTFDPFPDYDVTVVNGLLIPVTDIDVYIYTAVLSKTTLLLLHVHSSGTGLCTVLCVNTHNCKALCQ